MTHTPEPASDVDDDVTTASVAADPADPAAPADDALIRAENEDDDGYDPYSDRTAGPEPLFERDPWD